MTIKEKQIAICQQLDEMNHHIYDCERSRLINLYKTIKDYGELSGWYDFSEMSEFNFYHAETEPLELCKTIQKAGTDFNPNDDYFCYDYGCLYSFNTEQCFDYILDGIDEIKKCISKSEDDGILTAILDTLHN